MLLNNEIKNRYDMSFDLHSCMFMYIDPGSDTFNRRRINRKLTVEFEGLERFPQSLI